ncbi:hypothetical protein GRI44_13820 [Altererythrobacter confluentis]|uniref:HNH endonuclease n=1 Tax=Allopontixanthobacter confluentis TaxID=1849021 RepID=A0A6L7GIR4_9SPHN|nr:hypothetical protein [Allopontixanthobacter confluentis]
MGNATKNICYRCGATGTSREHFPPKAFFPKGGGIQLKTVRSCQKHNNEKSDDDMYVLVQVCLNAASGDNLPKAIFNKSVLGALKRSPAFRAALNDGAEWMQNGSRRYKVDLQRMDAFFDSLCCARYFERYGKCFDPHDHEMNHIYLNFSSDDPEYQVDLDNARQWMASFFQAFADKFEHYKSAEIDEIVYGNQIADPGGHRASITIAHSFYGSFEVISLLTRKKHPFLAGSPIYDMP